MAETRNVPNCFGEGGFTAACPPTGAVVDTTGLADVARALAHPARVSIIERFADGKPKMTRELVAPSGLAPSTMSEHLRILREAGVIVCRHDGSRVWYCLCRDRLEEFAGKVDRLSRSRPKNLRDSGPSALKVFVE